MCDLIDLNSPDPRKLAIAKLASPLIPGPSTPIDRDTKKINSIDFLCHGKRSSLDNNPFDKVLKETTEYAAKKDDPFETVLEKALQSEYCEKTTKYSPHKEDFTPKRKTRHSDVLKMNKTLDEPLLQGIMNRNLAQLLKTSRVRDDDRNVGKDLNNTHSPNDNEAQDYARVAANPMNGLISPNIIVYPPSPGNRSVLSQSAMNDSLSESSGSSGETESKEIVSNCAENAKNTLIQEIFNSDVDNDLLKPSKHRRSLSQGNQNSTESSAKETIFRSRSKSIIDTLKASEFSSASSVFSSCNDLANNAFVETGSSINSETFDVSRISATPKFSNSSCSSYSYSYKNKAFILDSQSSSRIFGSTSSAKSSMNLSSISRATGPENYFKTPLRTPVRIADLEMRLENLKIQSSSSIGELPLYSPNRKVQNFLRSDEIASGNRKVENILEKHVKLIDTDVFVPQLERADRDVEKTDTLSNCSSDSVFIENEKVDQSVFREAKLLARTFDELALQSTSNSFSSGDDLLYSRPRWNFDILPVSDDDEPVVDNLIELPTSPAKNEADGLSKCDKDVQEIVAKKQSDSKASEEIRELETQFIDEDVTRNKIMAATLLLDLEKIVHRENNPEAITLLENLEKVLGVKYESNAQLLATCLQGTNNLSKSPKKCITKLGSIGNIKQESLEKSHEDNDDAVISNGVNVLKICNDKSLEVNLNVEKPINKSEKSIITDVSPEVEADKVNLSEKLNKSSNISGNEEKQMLVDQTEALELITHLSKILGGRKNDSSPLSLLTNLRQVLNLATNQLNFENSQMTKSQNQESLSEIQTENAVPLKKPATKPKLHIMKLARKKSIDSSTKNEKKAPSTASTSIKRSMSLGSAQRNITPPVAVAKEKMKSYSKCIKKAFSYDAVPKPEALRKSASMVPEAGKGKISVVDNTGKYKPKKKSESELISTKKGPLKALLPVRNMQRRGSMGSKVAPITVSRTPPKSSSIAPSTFTVATSSTPNPTTALIVSQKSPKTKPVASSTPDGGESKNRKIRLQFARNTAKPKFSCNISPVTPLPHSIIGSTSSKGSSKNHRHNKTLSPPKRRESQDVLRALNTTESSIPKYSPLAGFSRRNSKETIKTLESSGSPKTSAKSQTPKKSPFVHSKSESQIPQSPLKTVNNQNAKYKPVNLISKLRRGSNGSNVSDKENCA